MLRRDNPPWLSFVRTGTEACPYGTFSITSPGAVCGFGVPRGQPLVDNLLKHHHEPFLETQHVGFVHSVQQVGLNPFRHRVIFVVQRDLRVEEAVAQRFLSRLPDVFIGKVEHFLRAERSIRGQRQEPADQNGVSAHDENRVGEQNIEKRYEVDQLSLFLWNVFRIRQVRLCGQNAQMRPLRVMRKKTFAEIRSQGCFVKMRNVVAFQVQLNEKLPVGLFLRHDPFGS